MTPPFELEMPQRDPRPQRAYRGTIDALVRALERIQPLAAEAEHERVEPNPRGVLAATI